MSRKDSHASRSSSKKPRRNVPKSSSCDGLGMVDARFEKLCASRGISVPPTQVTRSRNISLTSPGSPLSNWSLCPTSVEDRLAPRSRVCAYLRSLPAAKLIVRTERFGTAEPCVPSTTLYLTSRQTGEAKPLGQWKMGRINKLTPKLRKAPQPTLSHAGAPADADRAKRPPLVQSSAPDSELNPGDRVEGLANFGKPRMARTLPKSLRVSSGRLLEWRHSLVCVRARFGGNGGKTTMGIFSISGPRCGGLT
jgi:hypothetical protein